MKLTLPTWDPVRDLAPALEWLEEAPPQYLQAIKRLARTLAIWMTGSDPSEGHAILCRLDEEEMPDTFDEHEERLWRWYLHGLIVAHREA